MRLRLTAMWRPEPVTLDSSLDVPAALAAIGRELERTGPRGDGARPLLVGGVDEDGWFRLARAPRGPDRSVAGRELYGRVVPAGAGSRLEGQWIPDGVVVAYATLMLGVGGVVSVGLLAGAVFGLGGMPRLMAVLPLAWAAAIVVLFEARARRSLGVEAWLLSRLRRALRAV